MKMGHDKSEMQEYYNRLSAFLKNQTEYRGLVCIRTSTYKSAYTAGA